MFQQIAEKFQRPRPHAADPLRLLGGVVVPWILRGLWRPHGFTRLIMSPLGRLIMSPIGSFLQAMSGSYGIVKGNLGSWGCLLGVKLGTKGTMIDRSTTIGANG